MSWETVAQIVLLMLWAAIMADMVMTGLQKRAAAAAVAIIKIGRGEGASDGE